VMLMYSCLVFRSLGYDGQGEHEHDHEKPGERSAHL